MERLRNPEMARRAKTMISLLAGYFECGPEELGDRGSPGVVVGQSGPALSGSCRCGVAVLLLVEVAGLNHGTVGDLISVAEQSVSTALADGRISVASDAAAMDAHDSIARLFERAEREWLRQAVKKHIDRNMQREAILQSYQREYERKAEIRRREGLRWVL